MIVVGSIIDDLVLHVPRLPGPGETVAGATMTVAHGGKGANQAVAAARLGAMTSLVGCVGGDDRAGEACRSLEEAGVDCSWVAAGRSATGSAVVLVDGQGENMIAVVEGANTELSAGWVTRALSALASPGAVVLACLEVPLEAARAAALAAHAHRCRFVLNPAPAQAVDAQLIGLCDVVTPNQHELARLAGGDAMELLRRGAKAVVVTRGKAGASLFRLRAAPHHQPAFAVDALDATGAGDAFSGTLAWALGDGRQLEKAVALAAAAGALATRALGARASLGTRSEVEALAAKAAV